MKVFFDTSVLVAASYDQSPQHARSFLLFDSANLKNHYCAAHTLAEVYATLTVLPIRPRPSPGEVVALLDRLRKSIKIITLDQTEYLETIHEAAKLGSISGRIYDALIFRCAQKSGANVLYTWNVRHFRELGAHYSIDVREP